MTKKEANSAQIDAFARLIEALHEKNIKEAEFYNQLGLENPTQTWNNWKKRGLPHKEIPRLAENIELNIEWLAQGTGPKYKNIGEISGQIKGIIGSIEGRVNNDHSKNINDAQKGEYEASPKEAHMESPKDFENIDISELALNASAATQEMIRNLIAGLKAGRLKEDDIELLNAITRRLMSGTTKPLAENQQYAKILREAEKNNPDQ